MTKLNSRVVRLTTGMVFNLKEESISLTGCAYAGCKVTIKDIELFSDSFLGLASQMNQLANTYSNDSDLASAIWNNILELLINVEYGGLEGVSFS